MMIEDEELRTIFKIASEDHLQKLDEGFLHLEKHPKDQAKLEELLREAHSLKGDATMLGVQDVGTVAHHIEDILGEIKRGERSLSAEISDRLYQGLEAIGKLVHEAVTGEPSNVNVFYVLAYLMGSGNKERINEAPKKILEPESSTQIADPKGVNTQVLEIENVSPVGGSLDGSKVTATSEAVGILQPATASIDTTDGIHSVSLNPPNLAESPTVEDRKGAQFVVTDSAPQSPESIPAVQETNPPVSTGNYHIETIRVETQKLDALMTQSGELTVTKIRMAHRLTEIEEMLTLWEEVSRDTSVNQFVSNGRRTRALTAAKEGAVQEKLQLLQNLQHRVGERLEQLGIRLNRLRSEAAEDNARLDSAANELDEGIRTLRLLPLSTIFNLFPRMVRDLARQQSKQVELIIEGGETRADKRILEEMKDPLMHLLRNAIDHGIETAEERALLGKSRTATIRLKGYQTATNIVIEVADDGRGLAIGNIKQTALNRGICRFEELANMSNSQIQSLIFAPGFSTRSFVTEVSGRGVGLDVVRTNVERLKGNIEVESTPGIGCKFRLQLGTSLSTAHVLIVGVNGISYGIPVEFVQTTQIVQQEAIFALRGYETIILDDRPVSVARLADLLELPSAASQSIKAIADSNKLPCLILQVGEERLGIFVDALIDEQDVVLKHQSKLLKRVRNIAGATILGTGTVCMVLNPPDLIKSVQKRTISATPLKAVQEVKHTHSILLVEDSIIIRNQERRILEEAGYEVVTAVDGLDGFNKLRTRSFDAVISDIQMPNMDGLTLAAKIRQHKEYSEMPIILVTSLATDEDKRKGAEAGANAYLPKGTFEKKMLLDTLKRLV